MVIGFSIFYQTVKKHLINRIKDCEEKSDQFHKKQA